MPISDTNVLEQAAEPGVVQVHGCGGFPERRREDRIVQKRAHQRLQKGGRVKLSTQPDSVDHSSPTSFSVRGT